MFNQKNFDLPSAVTSLVLCNKIPGWLAESSLTSLIASIIFSQSAFCSGRTKVGFQMD